MQTNTETLFLCSNMSIYVGISLYFYLRFHLRMPKGCIRHSSKILSIVWNIQLGKVFAVSSFTISQNWFCQALLLSFLRFQTESIRIYRISFFSLLFLSSLCICFTLPRSTHALYKYKYTHLIPLKKVNGATRSSHSQYVIFLHFSTFHLKNMPYFVFLCENFSS